VLILFLDLLYTPQDILPDNFKPLIIHLHASIPNLAQGLDPTYLLNPVMLLLPDQAHIISQLILPVLLLLSEPIQPPRLLPLPQLLRLHLSPELLTDDVLVLEDAFVGVLAGVLLQAGL